MLNEPNITLEIIEHIKGLPFPSRRSRMGHKGNFGIVLGIGGSRGMAGSVAMAGKAALLTGAGLVRLAVPDPVLETVAGYYPEPTTLPCPADPNGRFSQDALLTLLDYASSATSFFLGPGLGRSAELNELVPQLLRQLHHPAVVDADGLNALSVQPEEFNSVFGSFEPQKLILTPHDGEFARLRGKPTPSEKQREERFDAVAEFAKRYRLILVLKGHKTITTDGEQIALNMTGNPGMATGGSGDVLTGILAALTAQNVMAPFASPLDVARLGVFLHGLAGDIAAAHTGEESVTATSILESLPAAIRRIAEQRQGELCR
jgi:NAD(P)H-hydrate epimerase